MWVVYFGLLFPIAQMSILRQAIASSIVLIGLLMITKQERLLATALIVAAAGFHSTAVMFLPLVVLADYKPDWRFALVVLAVGMIVMLVGVPLIDPLIEIVSPTSAQLARGQTECLLSNRACRFAVERRWSHRGVCCFSVPALRMGDSRGRRGSVHQPCPVG